MASLRIILLLAFGSVVAEFAKIGNQIEETRQNQNTTLEDMIKDIHEYIFGEQNHEALITGPRFYVPDGGLKSSSINGPGQEARCSRIGVKLPSGCAGSGWESLKGDARPWIQADLGKTFDIQAVATQGRAEYDQWVLTYHIASLQGSAFLLYLDHTNGGVKTFIGNYDRHTVIRNAFLPMLRARIVRLYPVTWVSVCNTRWELYGKPTLH